MPYDSSFQWLLAAHLPNAFGLVDLVVGTVHCKVHALVAWCIVFQPFVHTAIAVNRYCSLGLRERMGFIWTQRNVHVMLGLIVVLTTASIWPHYVSPCAYVVIEGRINGGLPTDLTLVQVGCPGPTLCFSKETRLLFQL